MSYKILAFDGGGIRGIYPAYILREAYRDGIIKDVREQADMFVGTSTGAIIAAALACNIDEETIYHFYKHKARKVFNETFRNELSFGLLTPKYSKKYLREILTDLIGDVRMNELNVNLLITSTDVSTGKAVIFRKNSDIAIVDAVLASISAPYYFSYEQINNTNFADGGLWACNPAIVGYVEAKYKYNIKESEIMILSFGTGEVIHPRFLTGDTLKFQEVPELISLLLTLQAKHLDSLSKIILGDKYTKINMKVSWLAIDRVGFEFLDKMKKSYVSNRGRIRAFFLEE